MTMVKTTKRTASAAGMQAEERAGKQLADSCLITVYESSFGWTHVFLFVNSCELIINLLVFQVLLHSHLYYLLIIWSLL